jgi:uncharacterized membrane protein
MKAAHFLFLGFVMAPGVVAASGSGSIDCVGTEPFWGVTIKDGKGMFSALGSNDQQGFTVGQNDIGVFDGFSALAGQWIHGQLSTGQFIRLGYFRATCSDNMSDQLYEYVALLEHPNGMHLAGCCGVVTTYTVTGVEEGDMLNVRKQPHAAADIVDKLANGTSPLRKMECRGTWCRIRYEKEIEGWVNSRYIEEYHP